MNKTIDNPIDREIARWLTYALLDTFTDYSLTHDQTDPNVILFNELEHTDEEIKMNHYPIRNDEHKVEDLENLKENLLTLHGFETEEEMINSIRYNIMKHNYAPSDILNVFNNLVKSEDYTSSDIHTQGIFKSVALNVASFLGLKANGIESVAYNKENFDEDQEFTADEVKTVMDNNHNMAVYSRESLPQDEILLATILDDLETSTKSQNLNTSRNIPYTAYKPEATRNTEISMPSSDKDIQIVTKNTYSDMHLKVAELKKKFPGILNYKEIMDGLPIMESAGNIINPKLTQITLEDSELKYGYSIIENHNPSETLQYLYFSPSLSHKYYAYYKHCRNHNQSIEEATSLVINMIADDVTRYQNRGPKDSGDDFVQ